MTLQPTLQAKLAASSLKPSIIPNKADLKGLSKQRLRINGKKKTKEEIMSDIVTMLKQPMTSGQLAAALQRTPDSLRRDYLTPLLEQKKIERQGDYYVRSGVIEIVVQKEHYDDIIKKSAFAQLPALADLVLHCRSLKDGDKWVAKIHRICTGKQVPTFKCRPEHWTEQTTMQFIAAWKQHNGKDRLGAGIRQTLRYVHEYILKKPVTDGQKELWGLDGTKDNAGIYNHVRLTTAQIHALVDYFLQKGDIELAAYVAFAIETFGRPEAIFQAKLGTLNLVPRTLQYATVAGDTEPNYDPIAVRQLRFIAAMHPNVAQIHTVHDEIFVGTLKEFKTNHAPWPKRIVDEQAVKTFKEYLTTRKGKGKYFGNDGEAYRPFNTRTARLLRPAYRELGLLNSDNPDVGSAEWYFNERPNYTFRHIGAHVWLERLGSYELLAEMGWEDVGIPKKFYAGHNTTSLDERIARKW